MWREEHAEAQRVWSVRISAPALSSADTTSVCPLSAAVRSGVAEKSMPSPNVNGAFGFAPALSSADTTSVWPWRAAVLSGVTELSIPSMVVLPTSMLRRTCAYSSSSVKHETGHVHLPH